MEGNALEISLILLYNKNNADEVYQELDFLLLFR